MRLSAWLTPGLRAEIWLSFAATVFAQTLPQGPPNVGIAPPNAPIARVSQDEWTARWWRWAISYPASRSPILDAPGEFVQEGNQGPVFFLAGNFGGVTVREATVRSDQWLALPILTATFWGPDHGRSELELRRNAERFAESVESLFVTINGRNVPLPHAPNEVDYGLLTWRRPLPAQSGSLSLDFAQGNPLGVSDGVKPAVIDGYFAFLSPLPPGIYDLRFGGRSAEFAQDSRYVIRSVDGPVAPTVKTLAFLGSHRRIDSLKVRFSQRLEPSSVRNLKNWLVEIYRAQGGLGKEMEIASIRFEPDGQTVVLEFAAPFKLADLQAVRVTLREDLVNQNEARLDGDHDGVPGGEFHAVFKTFRSDSLIFVEPDGDRVGLKIEGGGHLEGLRLENGGLRQVWLAEPGRRSRLQAAFAPGVRSDGQTSLQELVGTARVDASQILNHPAFRIRSLTPGRHAEGF